MQCKSLQLQRRTVQRLAKRLETAGIAYAVIGGMALDAHGRTPRIDNVALLLRSEGVTEFQRRFVPRYYQPIAGRTRTFVDPGGEVIVRFAVSGTIRGNWPDGLVPFPDPAQAAVRLNKMNVADHVTLIQINLAARWYRTLADAVELARLYRLDGSFAERLHASLRPNFMKCLDVVRRDDEFHGRDD